MLVNNSIIYETKVNLCLILHSLLKSFSLPYRTITFLESQANPNGPQIANVSIFQFLPIPASGERRWTSKVSGHATGS